MLICLHLPLKPAQFMSVFQRGINDKDASTSSASEELIGKAPIDFSWRPLDP